MCRLFLAGLLVGLCLGQWQYSQFQFCGRFLTDRDWRPYVFSWSTPQRVNLNTNFRKPDLINSLCFLNRRPQLPCQTFLISNVEPWPRHCHCDPHQLLFGRLDNDHLGSKKPSSCPIGYQNQSKKRWVSKQDPFFTITCPCHCTIGSKIIKFVTYVIIICTIVTLSACKTADWTDQYAATMQKSCQFAHRTFYTVLRNYLNRGYIMVYSDLRTS